MKIIESLLAAGTTSAPADPVPGWAESLLHPSPFVIVGIALLISMLFMGKGTKAKEEKAREEMLKQLKRGDRIQTIGGIQGAVTRAEETRVEVKVDESSNTKIWFARTAISRVLDAEKNEKAEK